MKIILDAQRINIMRSRLGEKASALIKNDRFLPLFRNRQKNNPEEFAQSVEIAYSKKIKNPSKWLAKVWSLENLSETIKIMRKYIEEGRRITRELMYKKRKKQELDEYRIGAYSPKRLKYQAMLKHYNLLA